MDRNRERPEIHGRSVVAMPGIGGTTMEQRRTALGGGSHLLGGDITIFKLWKLTRRHAANGVDCGDFYVLKGLPVSTRHNNGEGVGLRQDGAMVITADHWLQKGWRHLDELPAGWEEVNAETTRRQQEEDKEFSATASLAQSQEQIALLLAQMMGDRTHGNPGAGGTGAAQDAAGLSGQEAGGGGAGAPSAGGRRGARSEGR